MSYPGDSEQAGAFKAATEVAGDVVLGASVAFLLWPRQSGVGSAVSSCEESPGFGGGRTWAKSSPFGYCASNLTMVQPKPRSRPMISFMISVVPP